MRVNHLIRAENGLGFLAILYLYNTMDFPLWLFFLLLLAPDITMLGYLFNKRIGAILYNIGHSFNIPVILAVWSMYFSIDILLITALIWLSHILMDRCFGFGLKYKSSFKDTHLQRL